MSANAQLEMNRLVRAFHSVVKDHLAMHPTMEYGTVTSVSPLMVLVDGSQTPVACFQNVAYSPTVGDRVLLHWIRKQYTVAFALS